MLRILGSQNLLCWFPGAKVKSQTNAFHARKAHSFPEEVSLSIDLMPHGYLRVYDRDTIRYVVKFRFVLYELDQQL